MNVNKSLCVPFLILFLAMSLISGCATTKGKGNKRSYTGPVPSYYKVRRGDTVSKIAYRYGLDWRKVARLNNLDANYTIYVNQRLRLKSATRYKRYQEKPKKRTSSYGVVDQSRINKPTPRPSYSSDSMARLSSKSWFTPTSGSIIENFNLEKKVKGMRFSGSLGDPIFASQDGTVIYASNGLVEYGNLILIKHTNDFITAYAHNDTLLVKEGDRVSKGNQIATMGNSGTSRVMLEFQVRKAGKAVDPRRVLNN